MIYTILTISGSHRTIFKLVDNTIPANIKITDEDFRRCGIIRRLVFHNLESRRGLTTADDVIDSDFSIVERTPSIWIGQYYPKPVPYGFHNLHLSDAFNYVKTMDRNWQIVSFSDEVIIHLGKLEEMTIALDLGDDIDYFEMSEIDHIFEERQENEDDEDEDRREDR